MTRSSATRAEALLRSLVGVTDAEVRLAGNGRIESVRVATASALSNGQVVQNVRSALYAGLGLNVEAARIELVDAKAWVPTPEPVIEVVDVPAPVAANGNGNGNGNGHHADTNGHGNGNGHAKSNGNGAHGNGNGNGYGHLPPAAGAGRLGAAEPLLVMGDVVSTVSGATAPVLETPRAARATSPAAGVSAPACDAGAAPLVEKVELLRQNGRLRCRVVLAAGAERYSAVADAADDALAELQLAARVTCDALRAGQLTNAQLDGATIAHLAGRTHVVVALSEFRGAGNAVSVTGSAVVKDSVEHAAAVAVVQALRANSQGQRR